MRGAPGNKVPVILIAGCTAAGVGVIFLVILAIILCYRQNKKRQKRKTVMKDDATSIPNADGRNDDCLSMENELYCSSSEASMSREFKDVKFSSDKHRDKDNARNVRENGNVRNIRNGIAKTRVIAPNGDAYTIVDKSFTIKDPPKREIRHKTSPSGDMYAVVERS